MSLEQHYAAWDIRPPGRTAEAGLVELMTDERQLRSVPPGVTRSYRIEISSGAAIRLPFPEGQPYDAAW
jgi:hypothetical protein